MDRGPQRPAVLATQPEQPGPGHLDRPRPAEVGGDQHVEQLGAAASPRSRCCPARSRGRCCRSTRSRRSGLHAAAPSYAAGSRRAGRCGRARSDPRARGGPDPRRRRAGSRRSGRQPEAVLGDDPPVAGLHGEHVELVRRTAARRAAAGRPRRPGARTPGSCRSSSVSVRPGRNPTVMPSPGR